MSGEEAWVWLALALFIGAYVINRKALQILDEAKEHADRWSVKRDEAEALAREAQTTYENVIRIRGSR